MRVGNAIWGVGEQTDTAARNMHLLSVCLCTGGVPVSMQHVLVENRATAVRAPTHSRARAFRKMMRTSNAVSAASTDCVVEMQAPVLAIGFVLVHDILLSLRTILEGIYL